MGICIFAARMVELFSNSIGEGNEDLIIMHGLFGMGDNWQSLGKKWAGHYRVHLLDMRNHGHSPHHDLFSYDAMAEDILAYLDKHNIAKAHILGHSMGGKVAMLFAVLHPTRCSSLMVADIGPKGYPPHHQEVIKALEDLDLLSLRSRGQANATFGLGLEPGVRQFLLKNLYWRTKGEMAWRFNLPAILKQISEVGEALAPNAYFDGPAVFVKGGDSWYILEEDLPNIQSHFPQADLVTIPKAGHWLHAQQPELFFEAITDFLSGQ
jgi:esterase